MGTRRQPGHGRGESATGHSPAVSALAVLAACALAVAVVTGAGAGAVPGLFAEHEDEQDFAPPEVTSVERVDTDTVRLVLDDNHDVDEDTIDQNDFEVSPGSVVGANVTEEGATDAEVKLAVDGVGNQALTISSTNDTNIEDTNGNEFDPTGQFSEVVAAPEDPPRIHNATWADASRAERYEAEIDWPEDKPGETTVLEAYLTDGEGIDNSSVDADDFTVSRSRIADVATRADGENAFVLLVLSQNLDDGGLGDGTLTVALADDADIRDTEGRVGNRIERTGQEFVLSNTSPRLAGGSRVNDTAVELTFADDTDVAETSIQAHDFQIAGADLRGTDTSDFGAGNVDPGTLREYPIAGVNVIEEGSNASVVLRMPRPVDDDELLVRVREEAEITDTIGNRFAPDDDDVRNRVLIDGMDGVAPEVENYSLTEGPDGSVTLSLTPSERLGGIDVSVEGAAEDSLDETAFAFDESAFTYEATYAGSGGTLGFRLNSVTDEAGNTRQVDELRLSSGDARPPDPVVAIDFEASQNRTVVFDARHTSGPNAISNYTWEFDDGATATGLRVRKQFDPGTHLVALTATDAEGLSATDTATLDLAGGVGLENRSAAQLDGVRRVVNPELQVVQSDEETPETALLEVENPSPGMAVSAGDSSGSPLATEGGVGVDGVEVVPARYEGFSLSLSASGADAVSDAASAAEAQPVGGFSVAHDVPDEEFESATITTSVDAERLEGVGASPEDVTVLRRNGGAWERLPTSPTSDGDAGSGAHQFRVESPGFSRFAVVAAGNDSDGATEPDRSTPQPTQAAEPAGEVVVRNATLSDAAVAPEETVLVNATVENTGGNATRYTAGLSVDGAVVDTEPVTIPAEGSQRVSFRYRPNETGTVPVSVNGTSAGELTVGGGSLFGSLLGLFDPLLGLLPLGLLRPVALFVGLPALVAFLALKGLAIYLGY